MSLIACSSTKTKTKMKTKTKAFVRSCMFCNKPVTNEPIILCYVILRAWFVRNRHYLERTKTFVPGSIFVFVLTHEQVISKRYVLRWWPGGQLPLWWEQEPHQPNRVLRVTWRHHFPSPGSQLCRKSPGNVWSKKVSKKEIILIN